MSIEAVMAHKSKQIEQKVDIIIVITINLIPLKYTL